MTTPLEQAVAYIKAGEIEKGKQLLADVIRQNPRDENAWLWMTRCVTETEQKRYCFDKVLSINPQNQHAIEGLRRLNNPVPPQPQPNPKIVQQSTPQRKPKKSNSSILLWGVVGLLGIVCVCGMAFVVFPALINFGNSNQQNSPIAIQKARPNYKQMLEANGFEYTMTDGEGNPSYTSSCGAVAIVNSNSVGFVASNSDTSCAAKDIGEIISIMYPSEVFDFVFTAMNSLNGFDKIVTGIAVGYDISVSITEYEYTLVILIRDPQ